MKLAVLYAGQGAQHAGMGKDLYEAFPAFRAVMDEAAEAVDFDLKQLCFEGPDEQLSQTQFTQPCMVAFAAGVTAVLREAGLEVQGAAGLSLGEYSALHAAGVFDAKQAVSLVAFRGKAMMQAAEGRACGMAAVLGLERDALEAACEKARGEGVVEIANFNCPGQMAIAGDSAAVDAACVYVNASTRFTDGFEFGFGAEIGISNQKLHARGPMGLKELTTVKYVVNGSGQIRE